MTIVKINLHKVSASRNLDSKAGQVQINNNVSLKDVESMGFNVDGRKGLRFSFAFNCNYEPNLGKIEVEGQVLYVDDDARIEAIQQSWNKDKRVPMDVMEQIVNAALHKGNIQAIKVSEDISLPSPLPLPKVKPAASQVEAPSALKKK